MLAPWRTLVCILFTGAVGLSAAQDAIVLKGDTEFSSAGATFTAPKGWSVISTPNMTVMNAPEPRSHLAIVQTHISAPEAALASAWHSFVPSFGRPFKLMTSKPAKDGWSEHRSFEYVVSPNERAAVFAEAYRNGKEWTVLLFEGEEAIEEKRVSQLALVRDSLQPVGYHRESFAGREAKPLTPDKVEELRRFLETSMRKLGIPGASFAVIDHRQIVFEGGVGVRSLVTQTPVDANTLFLAASLTKGMTTLLLARLIDQRKFAWNEPVVNVLPDFKLGDNDVTRQVLIKHLVCACTGLPRQDLEWEFEYGRATAATTFALLAKMQPTSKFGELFQYSNLLAAAAGYVGAHAYSPQSELGAAYDEAMQRLVFDPLRMTSTTFDFAAAQKKDYAAPHGDDVDGHPSLADLASNYSIHFLRPAGGAWTSAHDLIRYVQLELNDGELPDGKQLVSKNNLLMRRRSQVTRGAGQSYGMGFSIDVRSGVTVVQHGGSMDGYKSELFFLPEAGAGVVLLTNSDSGEMLTGPFRRRVLEMLYGGKPEAEAEVAAEAQSREASTQKRRKELSVPAEPTTIADLAASYANDALGRIEVKRAGANLVFDFGEWKSDIASKRNQDGTVSLITIDPTVSGFEFVPAVRGGKRTLTIRDAQHEYVFVEELVLSNVNLRQQCSSTEIGADRVCGPELRLRRPSVGDVENEGLILFAQPIARTAYMMAR